MWDPCSPTRDWTQVPCIGRWDSGLFVLAVLGLCCCVGFSLVAASSGSSLVVVHGLFIAVASLIVQHGLQSCQASVIVAPGLESTGSMWHTSLVAPEHVGSSWTKDWIQVFCIGRGLYHWVTREAPTSSSLERLLSPGHQCSLSCGNCYTSLCMLSNGLCLALGFRGIRSVNTPISSTVVPEPRDNVTSQQKSFCEEAKWQGEATIERFHLISTAKVSVHSQDQPPDGGVSLPAGVPRPKPSNLPCEAPDMAKKRQAVAAISKFRHGPTASVSTIKGCFVPLRFGEVCDAVMVTGTGLLCDSQLPADAQHCLPVWAFLHFCHLEISSFWFLAQPHAHKWS